MIQIIKAGNSGPSLTFANLAETLRPDEGNILWDHFHNVGNLSGMFQWGSNANSGIIQATATHVDATHPGVINLRTSTSSSSAPFLITSTNHMTTGGGRIFQEFLVRFNTLSDATDTYTARIGLSNAFNSSTPADGAGWFEYTHGTNSGNWQLKTGSNSSYTTENTNVAPTTADWQRLAIDVADDGSSVEFFINEVSVGTISTNIPSGSRRFGVSFGIVKSAGTTDRILYIDWAGFAFVAA